MKIEFDEKCRACKGTGVYIGMAEREGAAVVCYKCKGTGCFHFVHEYEEFTGRQNSPDAKRVFQTNPGIMIGEPKDGSLKLANFGGMPYEDWLQGLPFPGKSEMRKFACPCWWYQSADYSKKPRWKECNVWGLPFSKCSHFATKEKCWERWDKEFGGGK